MQDKNSICECTCHLSGHLVKVVLAFNLYLNNNPSIDSVIKMDVNGPDFFS